MYKLRKFISLTLIITLMFARVLMVLPSAWADDVPTAPTAPSAPTAPTAPSAPTAPTAPALPTSGTQNTTTSLPTSPPAPTSPTSNTTDSLASPDTGNQTGNSTANGTSGATGPTGDTGITGVTGSTGSTSGSVNDPANTNTGPGSQNAAYENLNKKMETMNQNLADLQNKIDAVSTTGFNTANLNTLNGQVFTGDTATAINLMNKLNSNMTGVGSFEVFNVYGTYLNDIVFQMGNGSAGSFSNASPTVSKNVTTGPGSSNLADSSSSFTVKEANGNDAKLTNDINLAAVSGGNSASFNTGNGTVSTGNATAVGNVVNMANSNINAAQWLWGVVNIFGQMVGNVILPKDSGNTTNNSTVSPGALVANNATGPLSNNTANYQNTENATFDNKNTAQVTTNTTVAANTGNNTSDANTGGGSVASGNSNVAVSDSTIANTNTNKDDGTVWMVIVNKAGKWIGEIIGAPWGSTSASNALPVSQISTESVNSGTGPLSNNTASYTQNTDTNIANNNTASINNNINVTADTGNNTSSYNTGAGVIQTGNATAGLNVVNMANTNVIAKKFIAILVNVLGSWLGDVVTPEQQAQTVPTAPVLPTLPVLPTVAPIGGVDNTNYQQAAYVNDQQQATFTSYEPQTSVNYVYPAEYNQAVNQINYAKYYMRQQQNKSLLAISGKKAQVEEQGRVLKRGLFMSAAFAKATESSFPGFLLGGVSLNVTTSWLWIIPVAMFIYILRRRKKFNLEKYLNMLLSIVL